MRIDDRQALASLSEEVRGQLLSQVLPFWEKYTKDDVNGGYHTALDRFGGLMENEKNIWMQARQVWMFSRVYQTLGKDPRWLALAKHGADYLLASSAYAGNGRWNYLLTGSGDGVRMGTVSLYTDAFVLMGLCAYIEASGDERPLRVVRQTYETLARNLQDETFRDLFPLEYQEGLTWHGPSMIALNALAQASGVIGWERTAPLRRRCVHQVMEVCYAPQYECILEVKKRGGEAVENGLTLNPGHNFEALWFVMQQAKALGMEEAYQRALDLFPRLWRRAKDERFGGVLFMLDARGQTPDYHDWNEQRALAWDEKVWWTHAEALCALMNYVHETGSQHMLDEFEWLWRYCMARFRDEEYGEWYSVLRRDGTPRILNKGGLQKAAFHVPRSLWQITLLLKDMSER